MELPDAQFHQLMDCPGPGAYYVGWFGRCPSKKFNLMFAWAKICSLIPGKVNTNVG